VSISTYTLPLSLSFLLFWHQQLEKQKIGSILLFVDTTQLSLLQLISNLGKHIIFGNNPNGRIKTRNLKKISIEKAS
jgi:hypothetical protein